MIRVLRPSAKIPRQDRSRQTVERVLDAAEDVFIESGQAGFSVPSVSRRSGVSIPTIYKRFPTKEELLSAVVTRVAQLEDTSVFDAWESEDWSRFDNRDMINRLIQDLSTIWRERAPFMRAMMARRLQISDDVFFDQGLGLTGQRAAMFARVMLTRADEIVHPEPDQAIDFAFRLIISLCGRWTARTIETHAPTLMSWDEMLDRAGDVVAIYLFGNPAPAVRSAGA